MNNKKILTAILSLLTTVCFANNATVVIPDVNVKSNNPMVGNAKVALAGTKVQYTADQLEQSPNANLGEFFKQQQSIVRLTNTSGDSSQTALSLRGFGDNAVANSLILVDGFRLTNPSLLTPNFNSIPLSDIERIDIFQGSAGTLYGDQAVGGVINIITKHPKQFFANTIFNLGSYSYAYANFLVGDKKQNGFFYKVFGIIDTAQNYRNHDRQRDNNIAGTAGWDYKTGTINLNLQTYANTTNFPGGLTKHQFLQDPQQASNYTNNSYDRTSLLQLLNKQELNGDWILESRLERQQTNSNGFVFYNYNSIDQTTNLNQYFVGHIATNKIITGYNLQSTKYQFNNLRVANSSDTKQYDLYTQDVYPLNNKVDFTVGARSAWQESHNQTRLTQANSNNNSVVVSEAGLVYHYSPKFSLYVRRDGNFSFAKANEQVWVPSNVTSLNPQEGVSYETGANWLNDYENVKLSLYRLVLDNEIAFDPTQTITQPFGAYHNYDQTKRYGITLAENYYYSANTTFNAQINYVNARFAAGQFSGNLIPAVPAINANAGVTYQYNEHWQGQYNLAYAGTRYASDDVANLASKLSAYWLNDIAVQYLLKNWIFSFEVDNLFNKSYPAYASYSAFTNDITYYPATGRAFLLTAKMNID